MTLTTVRAPAAGAPAAAQAQRVAPAVPWLVLALCAFACVVKLRNNALLETWSTIALAVIVQAIPFLVLGVMLSAAIAAFVPVGAVPRLLPRRPALAVPVAGALGLALPGCECSSVPVAGRLMDAGAPPAAALTFMLAAPAINPIVLVATAVAFPNQPAVPLARALAALGAAVLVGMIWARYGPGVARCARHHHAHATSRGRGMTMRAVLVEDFSSSAGWLVLGGATAATLQTLVPRTLLTGIAANGLAAVGVLAALAVLLAVCSEADAFVAAGLTQFSLTSRLVFLTVGPMVDVKLVALQVGTFGRRFATIFAPLTIACAVSSALVIGRLLL